MAEIEKVIDGLGRVKHKYISDSVTCMWIDEAIQTIRELQEQIPKWHLVADGDLSSEEMEVLCVDAFDNRYVAYLKDDEWTDGCEYSDIKVIAWTELPKFEEVE